MRNVVYHLLALDGFALDDDSDWFTDGGAEMFSNLGRVIRSQDDVLLGKRHVRLLGGLLAEL